MRHLTLIILFSALTISVFPQVGGTKSYRFLDIPMTARAAALGGSNMCIWGDDINLIYSNPALLNPSMSKQVTFNYSNYIGDLNFGYLAYGHDLKKYGTIGGGIQFFNYGKLQGYDEFGEKTNQFKANDYNIGLNYAKSLEDSSFNIGIAFKTLISQYDVYRSFGNAIDFGITYHHDNGLTLSLLAKNIGWIYKSYSNLLPKKEPLPQNVQLGLSYKLSKAPFRMFVIYDQLNKWNQRYISPVDTAGKTSPFNSEEVPKDSSKWQKFSKRFSAGGDNFLRHITIGTEIVITKNFMVRIAYNHRRQREMILPERRGVNGLSLGFGFRIKKMGFAYSFTKMAFPGNSSIFSFTYQI
ncbi:MAG: type IX secretion system protein PorQ [Sphingobacteriaceae bacterium]|nr:type IX secretion system protein PorQ [Sphingobacteriaceae bacterium]